jgi:transcriptional regulator with XRE-family HTH domain
MTERPKGKALTKWIIERLRRFRESKGWTIEEFARKSGISLRYIHKIEDHDAAPSIKIIDEWLTACEKDFGSFFQELAQTEGRSADFTKWHDFLDQILECGDAFEIDGVHVVEGIKLNLLAISREVNRIKKQAGQSRDSPPPGKRPRAS